MFGGVGVVLRRLTWLGLAWIGLAWLPFTGHHTLLQIAVDLALLDRVAL